MRRQASSRRKQGKGRARTGLAFGVDLRAKTCLVEQLVDSIRQAVRSGALARNEVLPSFTEIARKLGTSIRVPRDAVRHLCAEGVLASRRGLGTTVIGMPRDVSRGRLLLVHPNFFGAYYLGAFISEIEERLVKSGYGVVQMACARKPDGGYDFRSLRDLLMRERFDLAFAVAYDDELPKPLAEASLPYVVCSVRPIRHRGAVASIRYSHMDAVPDFVAHCVEKGVRNVLQMRYRDDMIDAEPFLRDRGIPVETISFGGEYGMFEAMQRKAMELLLRRLERKSRPELVFFSDDYIAMGGLMALAHRGLKVPRDVKVVSFANTGFGPVSPVPLTRLAMDPHRDGKNVAGALVSYLRTGRIDSDIAIRPDYIRGGSF